MMTNVLSYIIKILILYYTPSHIINIFVIHCIVYHDIHFHVWQKHLLLLYTLLIVTNKYCNYISSLIT